ncbi:MAG: cyclophilin-like fold protein [Dehalococcoidia bacterium]
MPNKKIQITTQNITVEAELLDRSESDNFYSSLPFTGRVNTWGLEIYFSIDHSMELQEDASEIVNLGDIAFWPPGNAFCIFFGPTPASIGDEIRAASEVNLLGKIIGDPLVFKSVPSGSDIKIEAVA